MYVEPVLSVFFLRVNSADRINVSGKNCEWEYYLEKPAVREYLDGKMKNITLAQMCTWWGQ